MMRAKGRRMPTRPIATTEESIRSLFAPHGTVESVYLATDRDTGRSRGFAFVEMAEGDAEKAMAALNGTVVSGRAININKARPPQLSGAPGDTGPLSTSSQANDSFLRILKSRSYFFPPVAL
jgi:RNA recognition motif-containing protein